MNRMKRVLILVCSLSFALSLTGCGTKEEAYSGIADENGIVTGNTRPVPKKNSKENRDRALQGTGIIPDW